MIENEEENISMLKLKNVEDEDGDEEEYKLYNETENASTFHQTSKEKHARWNKERNPFHHLIKPKHRRPILRDRPDRGHKPVYKQWKRQLPKVQPYYAVKCNPEPAFISSLAALGASFDCASRSEIDLVLSLDVHPNRIIYTNPCKAPSHIKSSKSSGVNLTTFDSISELKKLNKHHRTCSLLLRIVPPLATGVRQSFSSKCGALPEEIEPLLRAAHALDLSVVGVAFHVGTDASVVQVYDTAIKSMAPKGWRYFAQKPFALAVCVIGKRVRGGVREYWVSDGMYGSLACMRLEETRASLVVLNEREEGAEVYESTVFGPTLDSTDVFGEGFELPEIEVGEWLVLPEMGAYAKCLGSDYNGFLTSDIKVHSFCGS